MKKENTLFYIYLGKNDKHTRIYTYIHTYTHTYIHRHIHTSIYIRIQVCNIGISASIPTRGGLNSGSSQTASKAGEKGSLSVGQLSCTARNVGVKERRGEGGGEIIIVLILGGFRMCCERVNEKKRCIYIWDGGRARERKM